MTFHHSILIAIAMWVFVASGCTDLKPADELPELREDGGLDAGGDGDGDGDAGDGDAGDGDAGDGAAGVGCVPECSGVEGCVEGTCQPMQLALEYQAACAINRQGHIVCWGVSGRHGLTYPPFGEFSAVSVGSNSACALRAQDGKVECWGEPLEDLPDSELKQIDVGYLHACGINVDDEIECWGDPPEGSVIPGGKYVEIAAGDRWSCAIGQSDRAIECWGRPYYIVETAPFSSTDECELTCDPLLGSCAPLGGTGLYECQVQHGATPSGAFHALSGNDDRMCAVSAVDAGNQAVCFGDPVSGAAPTDPARTVSAGSYQSACALLVDGSIECFGEDDGPPFSFSAGEHHAIATGKSYACALRTDGTIVCTGTEDVADTWRAPDRVACPDAGGDDSDDDGVVDACDNCITVANADQNDQDRDWLGDACDALSYTREVISSGHDDMGGAMAAGDLDRDGDQDLVVGSPDALFYLRNPSGEVLIDGMFDNTSDLAVGDLDGDLDLDIVATSFDGDVAIFLNPYPDNDAAWTMTRKSSVFYDARGVALGDMDGDLDLDIIAGSYELGRISWWRNTTNGGEHGPYDINWPQVTAVEAADVDNDDEIDIVAASEVSVPEEESLGAIRWWDNVNGTGLSMTMEIVAMTGVHRVRDIAIADLEPGDKLEIIAASTNGFGVGFLMYFRDDGAAWTATRLDLEQPVAVDAADVDGDDIADIVTCAGSVGFVYRNDPPGTFTPVVIDRSLGDCTGAVAFDYDGSPVLDVAFGGDAAPAHLAHDVL